MRKITSFAILFLLCISLAVSAFATVDEDFLYDKANLLTEEEEIRVHNALEKVSGQYDVKMAVVTLETIPGGDIADYADDLYDTMDIGYGDDRDGVLLVICMQLRQYHIISNGTAGWAITGSDIDAIGDAFAPYLSRGEYAEGICEFADQCGYYLSGDTYPDTEDTYENPGNGDWGGALIVCLIIGIAAGLIVAFVLKGQLKSIRRQNQADQYVKYGSMYITERSDFFLYRTVHRVKRESSNSSGRIGGGGGARSSGGGRF